MAISGVNVVNTIHSLFTDLNAGFRDIPANSSNFLMVHVFKINGQAQNEAGKAGTYARSGSYHYNYGNNYNSFI